jgi:hypothetical protein
MAETFEELRLEGNNQLLEVYIKALEQSCCLAASGMKINGLHGLAKLFTDSLQRLRDDHLRNVEQLNENLAAALAGPSPNGFEEAMPEERRSA